VTDCANANPDAGQPLPPHGGSATESISTDDEGGCVVGGGAGSVIDGDVTEVGDPTAAGVVLGDEGSDEGGVLRWVAGPEVHALRVKQPTTSGTKPNRFSRRCAKTEPPPPAPRSMP